MVSSRQSSEMSDENQQQLLALSQILTQSHTPLNTQQASSLRIHNKTIKGDSMWLKCYQSVKKKINKTNPRQDLYTSDSPVRWSPFLLLRVGRIKKTFS